MIKYNNLIPNLVRKIVHTIIGLSIILLLKSNIIEKNILILFGLGITFSSIICSLILTIKDSKNEHNYFNKIARKLNKKSNIIYGQSVIIYFATITFLLISFSNLEVIIALICLAIIDPISYLIGNLTKNKNKRFNEKFKKKNPLSLLFTIPIGTYILMNEVHLFAAVIIAIITSLTELYFIKIDDNFTIPASAIITFKIISLFL